MKNNEDDDCARLDTAFESTGVYKDEKFHADKFLDAYENSLKNRSAEEKKLWMPIVEKSIAMCEKIGKKFLWIYWISIKFFPSVPNTIKKSFCKTPEFVFTIRDCVRQQNFIDVPKSQLNGTAHCDAAKKFPLSDVICKCGVKYGEKLCLIDNSYWVKPEKDEK